MFWASEYEHPAVEDTDAGYWADAAYEDSCAVFEDTEMVFEDAEYDLGGTRSVRDWSGEGAELMGTGHEDSELLATPDYGYIQRSWALRRWILSY